MRKSGPPRGLISYLMLELLEEKPRYGYEILKEIEDISGGHWEPSYGSVYPILYKFEDEGWAERIEREDEPDRKYFQLTEAGHDHLEEKRRESGGKAREFADVILGFYHVYVAFATDDRFEVSESGDWEFNDDFSAWIAEQVIRHHERDFGDFERVTDTVEEFHDKHIADDANDADDADDANNADDAAADEADTDERDGEETADGTKHTESDAETASDDDSEPASEDGGEVATAEAEVGVDGGTRP